MKEKNVQQKSLLCLLAMVTMLMVCIVSSIPLGTKVQAEEALIKNQRYTLTTTKDTSVATTANPGETTVLVFGYVGCSKTRSTLTSISDSSWVKRSDIRVIFADTRFNSKEDVQQYEAGYDCPEMIFCYRDQDELMLKIMSAYSTLCGNTSNTLPMILLIDGDDNIRNLLTGKKTADELLNEIKKFHDIDESGSDTPPSENPDSGIENLVYGLNSIDGSTVSTKAKLNETTVLLFGYTTCGKTKATLQSIDQSDWVKRSDIRVIFAEVRGSTLAQTKEFAQNYTSEDIIFCHDESALNNNLSLKYLGLYNLTGGEYPFIVYIDQHNKIQNITLDTKTADEIIAEIEKFTEKDPTTPDDSTTTPPDENKPTTPGDDDSGDNNSKPTTPPDDSDTDNNTPTTPDDSTTTPPDDNKPTTPGDDSSNNKPTTPGNNNTGNNNNSTTTPPSSNNSGTTGSNTGSNSGSSNSNNGNTGSNTGTTTNTPGNTSSSNSTSGASNTTGSTTGTSTVNTNTGNTSENVPETTDKEEVKGDTTTSDTVNKTDTSTAVDEPITTDTTVTDSTNKSESDTKPTKTKKKKAQVKSVKTVKGKKVVSGTIKLNSGKIVKNATIKIYVNGEKITTAKTDSKGKFSAKLSKKLKKGDKVKLVVTSKNTKKFTDVIKVK